MPRIPQGAERSPVREGRIDISRPLNGDEIRITVTDETSRVQFIEARMSLTNFALALMGRGDVPLTFETRGLRYLGAKSEHKTELVAIPDRETGEPEGVYRERVEAALGAFEVDGWVARQSDAGNHHRRKGRVGDSWAFEVTFFRHVDPATGEPIV